MSETTTTSKDNTVAIPNIGDADIFTISESLRLRKIKFASDTANEIDALAERAQIPFTPFEGGSQGETEEDRLMASALQTVAKRTRELSVEIIEKETSQTKIPTEVH